MEKNKREKTWFESLSDRGAAENYGMSTALGATLSDLPTDVPQGSSAFDYTTKKIYFFDGVSWK